jgi:hypothetical protein
MNAIRSITPILLTKKIEPPSLAHEKGVFLTQEEITEYLQGRTITNLGAEVP